MRRFSKKRQSIETELKKVYKAMDEDFNGCFNCGSWNNPTHAHLIARSRRRDLIAEPKNIIHLCMSCHTILDHSGNRESLARWEEILTKIKELDEEYYNLIK